jgi:hypothetical protein
MLVPGSCSEIVLQLVLFQNWISQIGSREREILNCAPVISQLAGGDRKEYFAVVQLLNGWKVCLDMSIYTSRYSRIGSERIHAGITAESRIPLEGGLIDSSKILSGRSGAINGVVP